MVEPYFRRETSADSKTPAVQTVHPAIISVPIRIIRLINGVVVATEGALRRPAK